MANSIEKANEVAFKSAEMMQNVGLTMAAAMIFSSPASGNMAAFDKLLSHLKGQNSPPPSKRPNRAPSRDSGAASNLQSPTPVTIVGGDEEYEDEVDQEHDNDDGEDAAHMVENEQN